MTNRMVERKPFFSVVVPLFNKREFILRCVNSVLAQNYQSFELIVVDDGSKDGSADQLSDIKDSRLHVITKDNGGVGSARNLGINVAKGSWVAFLDADDAWLSEHLSELARIIDTFPDVGISTAFKSACSGDVDLYKVDESSALVREIDYFSEAAESSSIVHTSAVAIRVDVFEKIGGFSIERMGEDLELWAKVALNGFGVAVSSKVDVLYFQDTGGVTKTKFSEKTTPVLRSLENISPSVRLICQSAASNPSLIDNSSVKKYINSRLLGGVETSLLNSDFDRARQFSKLFIKPLTRKQSFFNLAVKYRLGWLLGLLLAFRKKTKAR